MQDQLNLRTLADPLGQRKRRLFHRLKPYRQSLHAAQGKAAIIGRGGAAQHLMRLAQPLKQLRIAHGHRTQQQVAVSANVFGKRLQRHVHAVCKRVKINSG
jgi:hypothetical protein